MVKKTIGLVLGALLCAWAAPAMAQDEGGSASASFSASSEEGVQSDSSGSGSSQRPVDNYFEFGAWGGMVFINKDHNFENTSTELCGADLDCIFPLHESFKFPGADFGLRIGYYPIRYVGVEFEGMLGFVETDTGDQGKVAALRGHGVLQFPLDIVTPFVLLGTGTMGANTPDMGRDFDPATHFGAGVKVRVADPLEIRGDFRDILTQKTNRLDDTLVHHQEVLVGVSYLLGLGQKEEPPKDTDGDGFLDPNDRCPTVPGVAPDGCPPPDTDGDGFLDPDDKCPTVPGIAPDGCPDRDPDKDGFLDPDDKCPTVPGVAPDGCPDRDPDKDGILDPDDKCPTEPETKNGYEDEDGCPDEVPEEVQKFTGVIEGIEFDFGKATIRVRSRPKLDEAARVLSTYPTVRIEVSGHTDSIGTHERNMELSGERAASVKEYLVSKGIDASRITTRGAGPDEPIEDNKTAAGRQKNRRIEFRLLQ